MKNFDSIGSVNGSLKFIYPPSVETGLQGHLQVVQNVRNNIFDLGLLIALHTAPKIGQMRVNIPNEGHQFLMVI